MDFGKYYDSRQRLVRAVARDLVGPGPEDLDLQEEVITDPPITRYVSGILFPQDGAEVDPAEDDTLADDLDETSYPDPAVAMSHVRYPSSAGMTFGVDVAAAPRLRVSVEAARYEPVPGESRADERWRRVPVRCPDVEISAVTPVEGKRRALAEGLELFYRVRHADDRGVVAVTVVLLNINRKPESGPRDAVTFFQPRLRVTAEDPTVAAFVARPSGPAVTPDEDVSTNRLLYRHRAAVAIGHGCAVEWAAAQSDSRRAISVQTTFVPEYDLLLSDSNPGIDTASLSMRALAEGNRADAMTSMGQMLDGYEAWITGLKGKLPSEPNLLTTAQRHIAACEEAIGRMRAGLHELQKADVWEAFRLANRAMLMQRSRTVWLKGGRPTPEPDDRGDHRWRPFQLAFVLLCIRGIADPDTPDRELADLLWFPTGGGKTEAYLGLIAFTLFLRRLRSGGTADGVAVIMRYTLRLLTIQQFERATLLICCCESIRRSLRTLGSTPISIGLWVGRGGTPNTLKDARIVLDRLRRGSGLSQEESNPVQLQSCPWCGSSLTHRNYYIADRDPRLVITCRTTGCTFESGLPVFVVDEDVYRKRPSLLIGTADKFASLPWREAAANVFNRATPGTPPPELIIQDELHLISGPLGTLAGLYETAVDLLCSSAEGVRPKVIASTATIRRAQSQAAGLFDRQVRQFPPPGLDARDSYFAVEAPPEARGTRMYVGLMAPGVSQTTLLVRTYAAILQRAAELDGDDAVRDAYWTLVGYFNSLRVLGGARMQVQDDVGDRMELLAHASGRPKRSIENRIELTSREPSGDIPSHLRRMALALPDLDALDVILATNMISVGVDVDRLGLMAVMGQPQSTSEYIQATSRVGRRTPGLVFTLFNASRSRDRSHFESFVDYHSALYRQVESTSVTPFSPRSRDRGLHAVLIALARLMLPEFRSNDSAAHVARHLDKLERVKDAILDRARAVDAAEAAATAAQLDQIIRQWVDRAALQRDLVFLDFQHPDRALLVDVAMTEQYPDDSFPTLWSLRDVDLSSNLYMVG